MCVRKAVAKDLLNRTYLSFAPLPSLIRILQVSKSMSATAMLHSSDTLTAV